MKHLTRHFAAVASLALLAAMFAQRVSYGQAEDATAYHAEIKVAVDALPYQLGPWQGVETHVPQAALALIRPNAISSRRYTDAATGRTVDLLIVQCRDARDMAGHYPPVCYPAHGWHASSATPAQWQIEGLDLRGMVYQFDRPFTTAAATVSVVNLLLLPDGRQAMDMKPVREMASDYTRHVYGAAQIQILFRDHVEDAERDRIVQTFLKEISPVITSIWGKREP